MRDVGEGIEAGVFANGVVGLGQRFVQAHVVSPWTSHPLPVQAEDDLVNQRFSEDAGEHRRDEVSDALRASDTRCEGAGLRGWNLGAKVAWQRRFKGY